MVEAVAKFLSSRPVWPWGVNVSGYKTVNSEAEWQLHVSNLLKTSLIVFNYNINMNVGFFSTPAIAVFHTHVHAQIVLTAIFR